MILSTEFYILVNLYLIIFYPTLPNILITTKRLKFYYLRCSLVTLVVLFRYFNYPNQCMLALYPVR